MPSQMVILWSCGKLNLKAKILRVSSLAGHLPVNAEFPASLRLKIIDMKKHLTTLVLTAFVTASALFFTPVLRADDNHEHHAQKVAAPEKPGKPALKPYKLETCIVSDEKLGEMGKPVVFVHEGQEIKLCCKDCRKDFDKDPAKYLKKLEEKKSK